VDVQLAALWEMETQLLARFRQGPPGTSLGLPPAATISIGSIDTGAPWPRSDRRTAASRSEPAA